MGGYTHFDDIFSALLTIFQSVTLQGWSSIQVAIMKTSGPFALVYFIFLCLVGGLFVIKFTIAIITSRVTQLLREMARITAEKRAIEDRLRREKAIQATKQLLRSLKAAPIAKHEVSKLEVSDLQSNVSRAQAPSISPNDSAVSPTRSPLSRRNGSMARIDTFSNMIQTRYSDHSSYSINVNSFENFERQIRSTQQIGSTTPRNSGILARIGGASFRKILLRDKFRSRASISGTRELGKIEALEKLGYSNSWLAINDVSVKAEEQPSIREILNPKISDKLLHENVFLLRVGQIELPSIQEVLPKRFESLQDPPTTLKMTVPPYKAKIIYNSIIVPPPTHSELPRRKIKYNSILKRKQAPKSSIFFPTENSRENSPLHSPQSRRNALFSLKDSLLKRSSTKIFSKPLQSESDNKLLLKPLERQATIRRVSNQELKRNCIVQKAKHEKMRGLLQRQHTQAMKLGIVNAKNNKESINNSVLSLSSEESDDSDTKNNGNMAQDQNAEKNISKHEKMFKVQAEINDLHFGDSISQKPLADWSGQDVRPKCDSELVEWLINIYNNDIKIWPQGFKGRQLLLKHAVKSFVKSAILENIMILMVLINTVMLGFNRYNQPESEQELLQNLNIAFTIIYTLELILKLFGLGIVGYFSDNYNYVDLFVVLLSLVEIIFLDGESALSAFLALRIFKIVRMFRTFRVLRVAKLIKYLRSMQLIIEVIGKSVGPFAYINILLIVFIFIYALLGMQLFSGEMQLRGEVPRQNFDSFHKAFLSIFQVLTIENWHVLLLYCMRVQNGFLVSFFFTTWIFIGHYVLLSLFLAMMFDAFSKEDEAIEKEQKFGEVKDGVYTLPGNGENDLHPFHPSELAQKRLNEVLPSVHKKKGKKPMYDVKTLFSFFIFYKKNPFRRLCWRIVFSPYYEWIALVIIILSSVVLALDTYYLEDEDNIISTISFGFNTFCTTFFTIEALLKSIAYGFFLGENSYLQDNWNKMDFVIVVTSLVDLSIPNIDLRIVKIFRLLRVLRPLRFITHNSHMKFLVNALFSSISGMIYLFLVVLVFFVMFGIVGVSFFAGKFQYCSISTYDISTRS